MLLSSICFAAVSRQPQPKRAASAIVVVRPTLNNLFLTVLSPKGGVLYWSSSGSTGNSGPRRATPLAAEQTGKGVASWLVERRVRSVEVRVAGPLGSRSRSAVRGLFHGGRLLLRRLRLVPPLSHNGLRRRKQRRVLCAGYSLIGKISALGADVAGSTPATLILIQNIV